MSDAQTNIELLPPGVRMERVGFLRSDRAMFVTATGPLRDTAPPEGWHAVYVEVHEPPLTGDCETDCQRRCMYPGQFAECEIAAGEGEAQFKAATPSPAASSDDERHSRGIGDAS